MTTKREKENYSVTKYAERLEMEGYSSDRAIAASLDMLRRGTLPLLAPPMVSPQQKEQQKKINQPRREVVRDQKRKARNQRNNFKRRLRALKKRKAKK